MSQPIKKLLGEHLNLIGTRCQHLHLHVLIFTLRVTKCHSQTMTNFFQSSLSSDWSKYVYYVSYIHVTGSWMFDWQVEGKVSREPRAWIQDWTRERERARDRIAPSKSYKAMNNLLPPLANPDLFVRWLRRVRLYWNEGFLCPNLAFAAVSQSERESLQCPKRRTPNLRFSREEPARVVKPASKPSTVMLEPLWRWYITDRYHHLWTPDGSSVVK